MEQLIEIDRQIGEQTKDDWVIQPDRKSVV